MARYSASEQSAYETSGQTGFRLEKDNDKARVVFLYEGPESIDGWACHRFAIGSKGYTVTMDCPRSKDDPLDKCPACAENHTIYTRLFVRLYNLNTNKVEIWDRASGFRAELLGMMAYFNPLYSKVYEITRHGSGLQTKYQFQSLNDSGFTPEQYQEYVKQCDEVADKYVQPADAYQQILARWEAAKKKEAEESVNVDPNQAAQGAWGQAPAPGAWGQAPQNQAPAQGWGQAPAQVSYPAPAAPQPAPAQPPQAQGWGQAPAQPTPPPAAPQAQGWGQAPAAPQPAAPQNPAGQAPAWGQQPSNWGQQQ